MVFFTVLTQIMTLLAFILPIKFLFMFQDPLPVRIGAMSLRTQGELALFLTSAVALILLVQLFSGKFAAGREEKCSRDIWENNSKLMIYANQESMATSMYSRYVRTLTGLVLVTLVLIGLLAVEPVISIALVLYFLTTGLGVVALYDHNHAFRTYVENAFGKFLNLLGVAGFFVLFVVVLYRIVYGETEQDLILAVIALILIRHMLNNTVALIQGIRSLYENRIRLEAIFLTGQVGHAEPAKTQSDFWRLLAPEARKTWMRDVLSELLGAKFVIGEHAWFEMGSPSEFSFVVSSASEGRVQRYLLKLYPKQQKTKALREAAILSEPDLKHFALPFIGTIELGEHQCNVFEYEALVEIDPQSFADKKDALIRELLLIRPPKRLIEQYISTHKLLYQRPDETFFERIAIAAEKSDMAILEEFKDRMKMLNSVMEKMPLRLLLPQLSKSEMMETADGRTILLSLGLWLIEPFGTGFNCTGREGEFLRAVAKELDEPIVCAEALELITLFAECERYVKRNLFKAALQKINEIMALSDKIAVSCPERKG